MAAAETQGWRMVDEGWGRRAVEFADAERAGELPRVRRPAPAPGGRAGDRLLDVACGAGLAVELAAARGATCAGIDASPRLVAVARDRVPEADLRVGDMHELPWADAQLRRGHQLPRDLGHHPGRAHRGAPGARAGRPAGPHRVGAPQGLAGGVGAAPFTLASRPQVENQAAMVALGRPGVGEELLARSGFVDVRAGRGPVRLGVRGPRRLRPCAGVDRTGVRGDPDRRGGGVRGVRRGAGPASGSARGCRCGPRSPWSATWPAQPVAATPAAQLPARCRSRPPRRGGCTTRTSTTSAT